MQFKLSQLLSRLRSEGKVKLNTLYQKITPSKSLDKKLVFSLRQSRLPNFRQLKHLLKFLNKTERLIIKILLIIILLAGSFLFWWLYRQHTYLLADFGGEYTEGLVGAPKYINPILAQTNDVDRDLSKLVFSSLLQYDQNQNLITDLAEKYKISADQKTYTFYLKENILWHDGEKLTADDVIFTVKSIQDPEFKSPLANSLRGVAIDKKDELTVTFTLQEPFAPFLEILTFGILPEHVWGNVPPSNAPLAEFNIKPVGSGPFVFTSLIKDKLGNIKSITLERNKNYYQKQPYIKKLSFKFYPDFTGAVEALKNKNIEGLSFLPKELKSELVKNKNLNYYSLQIPQYTALFLNQKTNQILQEDKIREALALSVNKEEILRQALRGEGIIIHGPILPGYLGYNPDIKKYAFDPKAANQLLEAAGWEKISIKDYAQQRLTEELKKIQEQKEAEETPQDAETIDKQEVSEKGKPKKETGQEAGQEQSEEQISQTEQEKTPEELLQEQILSEIDENQPFFRKKDGQFLRLILTTVEQRENITAAQLIKNSWQQIGFGVTLNIVPPTEIKRRVIRERDYQVLLYAEILGADPDPYPFWHSSQNEHPGVNLAIFTDRRVDQLLEEARGTGEPEERRLKYIDFQNILANELPAIFLYSPTYTYVVNNKIQGISAKRLASPADRFAKIEEWYIETKRKLR